MAEFSKEYLELIGEPAEHADFSLTGIAYELVVPDEDGWINYKSVICEGLGCIAVGIDRDNEIWLAMPQVVDRLHDDKVKWVRMQEVITSKQNSNG